MGCAATSFCEPHVGVQGCAPGSLGGFWLDPKAVCARCFLCLPPPSRSPKAQLGTVRERVGNWGGCWSGSVSPVWLLYDNGLP